MPGLTAPPRAFPYVSARTPLCAADKQYFFWLARQAEMSYANRAHGVFRRDVGYPLLWEDDFRLRLGRFLDADKIQPWDWVNYVFWSTLGGWPTRADLLSPERRDRFLVTRAEECRVRKRDHVEGNVSMAKYDRAGWHTHEGLLAKWQKGGADVVVIHARADAIGAADIVVCTWAAAHLRLRIWPYYHTVADMPAVPAEVFAEPTPPTAGELRLQAVYRLNATISHRPPSPCDQATCLVRR